MSSVRSGSFVGLCSKYLGHNFLASHIHRHIPWRIRNSDHTLDTQVLQMQRIVRVCERVVPQHLPSGTSCQSDRTDLGKFEAGRAL